MIDKTVPPRAAKPRKLALLLGATTLAFLASCHTTDPSYNHWEFQGLTPRMAYHLLSYDTNSGVPYYEHVNEQRSSINLTIRRHLLNSNPENPFQRDEAWIPRRKHFSPLPDPFHFFHLSSVAFGAAMLGAGGAFIPFPYEAILVMFEDGGPSEIWDGTQATFTGKDRLERGPAPVSEFKVHNR